jgi:aspartate kinase
LTDAARNPDGPIIVRKYGGSSLAGIPRLREVARNLREARDEGLRLVVVVSAMGDQTDELARLAREANPEPPRREMDMLLTVGERISMSLLSMALAAEGVPALSLTGSQVGIITDASHTDARIREVKAYRIREALAEGKVVVVAGFQGYSAETRDITTLGRGGSDTTAVALAHALEATRCEILKDVPGVMTADPKLVPDARRLEFLGYQEMQAIADAGCGVVHPRAVAYAARHGVPLYVGSSFAPGPGTVIGPSRPPELSAPAAWRPLVLTEARDQAALVLCAPAPQPPAALVDLARRAAAACPLTAEWLETGATWRWEGWGPQTALERVAAAATEFAGGRPQDAAVWLPRQTVLTLAGRRPESWTGALAVVAHLLPVPAKAAIRLRTDGQAVRLLGPAEHLRDLLPALHALLDAD